MPLSVADRKTIINGALPDARRVLKSTFDLETLSDLHKSALDYKHTDRARLISERMDQIRGS